MSDFLNSVRCADNNISVKRQIIGSICIMSIGVILGVISKYLDCTPVNALPFILEYLDSSLDIRNFLGRFAIWIFLAVCISVYSVSPIRAAINVFLFFAGMVTSYYLYSTFIGGFFPKSYAMIWFGFTAVSPLPAFICWYAKGESKVSLILSALIVAVLFDVTFYGLYINIRFLLEPVVFVCGLVVLKRRTIKETAVMTMIGVVLALVLKNIAPFRFLY